VLGATSPSNQKVCYSSFGTCCGNTPDDPALGYLFPAGTIFCIAAVLPTRREIDQFRTRRSPRFSNAVLESALCGLVYNLQAPLTVVEPGSSREYRRQATSGRFTVF
jgi:hypothetical protein